MVVIWISSAENLFNGCFRFSSESDEAAWYDFDGAVSREIRTEPETGSAESAGASLRLNADREVYAVYTAPDGTEHYGTVGDEENEFLADNFGVEPDMVYCFYEKPETKEYYV